MHLIMSRCTQSPRVREMWRGTVPFPYKGGDVVIVPEGNSGTEQGQPSARSRAALAKGDGRGRGFQCTVWYGRGMRWNSKAISAKNTQVAANTCIRYKSVFHVLCNIFRLKPICLRAVVHDWMN